MTVVSIVKCRIMRLVPSVVSDSPTLTASVTFQMVVSSPFVDFVAVERLLGFSMWICSDTVRRADRYL